MLQKLKTRLSKGAILIKNAGGPLGFSKKLASIIRQEGIRGILLRYMYFNNFPVEAKIEAKLSLKQVLARLSKAEAAVEGRKTTIIVPVYNGLHHLTALCETLFDRTPAGTEFIFVDDCSPDRNIQAFFKETLKHRPNVSLLRNEKNLGFTGTINRAAALVETGHFVILNSDVIVHENWLPRLLAPLESGGRIASATPFSNAAVFFSYPKTGEDNEPRMDGIAPEEIDRAFARIDGTITPECDIYAGVGFCMAISLACWRETGPLDAETFGKGYGEEVDWCLRAKSHGWHNVLAPNLYIQHIHGGSFSSEEKKTLSGKNLNILHRRWPRLARAVHDHRLNDPWEAYRALATLLLADTGEGCAFMIDFAGEGGGAYAYREKTIAGLKAENRRVLLLTYSMEECQWVLAMRYLGDQYRVKLDDIDEIAEIFSLIPVKQVIVNNLAFCNDIERVIARLSSLKKTHGFPMEYKLHDYFSICPSFFLLDDEVRYCGGGLPIEKCLACSRNNRNFVVERRDIPQWRLMWSEFFQLCDTVTAFSEASLRILQKVYPLSGKTRVIEHEPLEAFTSAYLPPPPGSPLVIGFMGVFVQKKGSGYINQLADILQQEGKGAKIIVFGPAPEIVKHPNIEFTGRYRHSDIPELCNRHGVRCMVFPSPWPETFSYVSQECMMLGIPFVCFDIGAPAERVRKYNYRKGMVVSEFSAMALRDGIEKVLAN